MAYAGFLAERSWVSSARMGLFWYVLIPSAVVLYGDVFLNYGQLVLVTSVLLPTMSSSCLLVGKKLAARHELTVVIYSLQGVEKLIASKMLLEGSNRRIHSVNRHSGMVRQ